MLGRAVFGLALAASVTPALAEPSGGDDLRGFIDIRAGAADGEVSFLDEGFGKSRFGGDNGDWDADALLHGMLSWRHHLTWNLDSVVTVQGDSQLDSVGVVEAYLSYRGAPSDGWRFSGRAGLFYPPISLEHDGLGWTPTETITPSAINTWIGEEVKVAGIEASARHAFGDQEVAITAALFGHNDTAGTLLAFRGWGLDDISPSITDELSLPERSFPYQESTRATEELDNRIGYYAQARYRPIGNLNLDVTYYDNRGDRLSDAHGQTDWATHFTNVGARWAINEETRLLAQAMTGRTVWGRLTPFGYWVDVDFNSAYVLLARDLGDNLLSGRVDYFAIGDNNGSGPFSWEEEGWAATAAYQIRLSPEMRLAFEGMHISSDRPNRADQGLAADQEQNQLQTSLKVSF